MSNREKRRAVNSRIAKRLNKSTAYVILSLDNEGILRVYSDVARADDPNDYRHRLMHRVREDARVKAVQVNDMTLREDESSKEAERVRRFKEARSRQLQQEGIDGNGNESGSDADGEQGADACSGGAED